MDEIASYLNDAVRLLRHPSFTDERGMLIPVEFPALPFSPVRMFTVSGVPRGGVRGDHGHTHGYQLLRCISGEVVVDLRREDEEARVALSHPQDALLIGPQVWARQTYRDPESVLVVLASEPYHPDSYLTDRR